MTGFCLLFKLLVISLQIALPTTNPSADLIKSADGLVVGSAICKEITRSLNNRQNPVTNVSRLVKNLKKKTT